MKGGDLYLRMLSWMPFRKIITTATLHEFCQRYSRFSYETRPAVQVCFDHNVQDPVVRSLFPGYLRSHSIKPACSLVLSQCQLLGDGPVCITSDRVAIPDSYPGRSVSLQTQASAHRSLLLPRKTCGLVCSLIDPFSANYFHWFADVIPRLKELEDIEHLLQERASLLVPGWMPQWQKESLQLLAGDRSLIPHQCKRGLFRLDAEKFVACSAARFNGDVNAPFGAMDPNVYLWLRNRVWSALQINTAHVASDRSRIYVSRSRAESRRICNEPELSRALAGHGFTEVCLEDLSFLEQVKLFSSASHVVAAHGSGLTNVLFAKDLKVIELFSEGHGVRPEYFQLSTVLGHQYRAVVSHSVNDANDFRVDVNVVLNLLAISSACP